MTQRDSPLLSAGLVEPLGAVESWNNGPYSQQGCLSGDLLRSPSANPAVFFAILSSPRPPRCSPGLHSFSETRFLRQKPCVRLRPHLTAVAPGLAPQILSVPFHRRWVPLPEKPTSFTCLFFMVSLFLALSVMPIPCTLDERIQGQRT